MKKIFFAAAVMMSVMSGNAQNMSNSNFDADEQSGVECLQQFCLELDHNTMSIDEKCYFYTIAVDAYLQEYPMDSYIDPIKWSLDNYEKSGDLDWLETAIKYIENPNRSIMLHHLGLRTVNLFEWVNSHNLGFKIY